MVMHGSTRSELPYYEILWGFHTFVLELKNWWTTHTFKKATEITKTSGAQAVGNVATLIKPMQEASKKAGLQVIAVHGT